MAKNKGFHVLILAGSRAGGEPFVRAEGKSLKATLDIAGKPMLGHVLESVASWPEATSITISLPEQAPLAAEAPSLNDLIEKTGTTLIPTSTSPCKSVQLAMQHLRHALDNQEPVLIVTGDAPLLNHDILTEFTSQNNQDFDLIAGITKVDIVENAYPEVKRTRINLRGGAIGGCNLYMLNNKNSERAIQFWQKLENNRKKPWRLASSFWMMALYSLRMLTLKKAQKGLSKKAGCRIGFALLSHPHAGLDVDKAKDLTLVRKIFKNQAYQ